MASNPHYTIHIRLPFPRGDFVDPPLVDWDAAKDQALWKILSQNSRSSDIDWKNLAANFEVPVPFLLQQAALLYERQLSSVREQMKRIGKLDDTNDTPPASSSRNETPKVASDQASLQPAAGRALRAPMSRNTSTQTVTQLQASSPRSPQLVHRRLSQRSNLPSPREEAFRPGRVTRGFDVDDGEENEEGPASSSSDTDDSDNHVTRQMSRSQAFRRPPPRFGKGRRVRGTDAAADDEDDDEEADGPVFLPFSGGGVRQQDPSSTLRQPIKRDHIDSETPVEHSSTSASETSSAAHIASPPAADKSRARADAKRDSREGTPSMGSSFSDLDDSSVTRSALEEALASNMRRGNMASRMSSIGMALKSRRMQ